MCVNRRCSFEAKVPESLKCQGCASWAQSKNLAPLSVLFCRRKEHAELRSPFAELKKDLELYIGKLGTMIVDSSVRFAANYTYLLSVFNGTWSQCSGLGSGAVQR